MKAKADVCLRDVNGKRASAYVKNKDPADMGQILRLKLREARACRSGDIRS